MRQRLDARGKCPQVWPTKSEGFPGTGRGWCSECQRWRRLTKGGRLSSHVPDTPDAP